MRFTRTVVLRALLGGDLGPFTDKIDEAWITINEHVGNSFWSLGIAERFQRAKARRFEAARADAQGCGRLRHHAASAQPVRQRGSVVDAAGRARRGDRRGHDRRAAARRGHDVPAGRSGDDVAGADVDVVSAVAASRGARQRLEHELDTVLNGRPPEYADLANLPYTRMVVDESMRLYPPAWGFSRQALADDTAGRIPSAARMARVRHPVRPASAAGVLEGSRRPSIPSASHRSRAPIDRSSSTCRSAPGRGNASAISSR